MSLKAGEVNSGGFVRDANGALSVSAEGSVKGGGFLRDSDGRLVLAGTPSWAEGDNVTVYTANPEGAKGNVKQGTAASPVTSLAPTFKVSRTSGVTGGVAGDGSMELGAIFGSSSGTSASKVQEIGVVGAAKNAGTAGEPDACGVYGVGRILAGGKGRAFGGFFLGRRDGEEQRATGVEVAVENVGGSDSYDITNGAETTKGIWLHGGTAKSAVGLQVGTISEGTPSFDVAIGINKFAVGSASFQDNSSAAKSIEIKGTHATASLEVASNAGTVIFNGNPVNFGNGFMQFLERSAPATAGANTARLYIKDNGSGKTQLAVIFESGAEQVIATQP